MHPRAIKVEYSVKRGRWEASSVVEGSVYSVWGHDPGQTLRALSKMLRVPGERWRITRIGPDRYACQELVEEPLFRADRTTVDSRRSFA